MDFHWSSYTNAVEKQAPPMCSNPPIVKYENTSDDMSGKTGFQDLVPPNPQLQARYDAMSAAWEGISPSNSAIIQGLFTSAPSPIDKNLPKTK